MTTNYDSWLDRDLPDDDSDDEDEEAVAKREALEEQIAKLCYYTYIKTRN